MSILPSGLSLQLTGNGVAASYAGKLLEDLGAETEYLAGKPDHHPAQRWAESGLMALTGNANELPLMCPAPLASCGDGALAAFRAITGGKIPDKLQGADLMAERAAIVGLERNGATSPGGGCKIIASNDGHIGLSLARDSDWEQLPAWLELDILPDWDAISHHVAMRPTAELLERGRLLGLGLAVAHATPSHEQESSWLRVNNCGKTRPDRSQSPRILDLSSLWAGPLCSHLWQLAGAEVIKVESTRRPDGARQGPRLFYDLLNQGKRAVALDLHTSTGQRQLLELIHHVDIVIEGSRPRALRQMGIFAEQLVDQIPGLSWVSITGYGREEPQANWIAYGDDAGVAAGLSALMYEATGKWVFCGDAIADPLTGLHAAVAGWASWMAGGGHLIDISLYKTVRHCLSATDTTGSSLADRQQHWSRYLLQNQIAIKNPAPRVATGAAMSFGADTCSVLNRVDW